MFKCFLTCCVAVTCIAQTACSSGTLSTAQRLADLNGCLMAVSQAGIPLVTAINDKESSDPAKAQAAKDALDKVNALPACLKVGANAATVIDEHVKAKQAQP